MANLLEQADILKGLPDEQLNAELSMPSGSVPPFLIATEVQRRKSMRDRYAGEMARRQPQTTVVEDLMGGLPAAATPMPESAMAPMGQMGAPPPQRSFATGGLVDAVDPRERYNELLAGLGSKTDRARALALIAAGAGIMGGGSSNTLKNVGAGISAAIPAYQSQVEAIDAEELNLLRGIAELDQADQQSELARLDRDFRERQLAQDLEIAKLSPRTGDTADVANWKYRESLSPEQQAEWDKLHPTYNPNAVTDEFRRQQEAADVFNRSLNSIPDPPSYATIDSDPQVLAREKQRQAALLSYPQWVQLLGAERAAAMAHQYGVTDGDILTLSGGTGGEAAPAPAPSGASSGGAIPFTDYF